MLDFLVSNELLFGGTDASPADLDAWSGQALALASSPVLEVARGGVLVALGRAEEAQGVLMTLLGAPIDAVNAIICRG